MLPPAGVAGTVPSALLPKRHRLSAELSSSEEETSRLESRSSSSLWSSSFWIFNSLRRAASCLILRNASRAFGFAVRAQGWNTGAVANIPFAGTSVAWEVQLEACVPTASRACRIPARDKPGGEPYRLFSAFQFPAPTGVLGSVSNAVVPNRHRPPAATTAAGATVEVLSG